MKQIKIKFVGFWNGFTPERSIIYKIMKKHYDVIITDDADYIICSIFGDPYAYTTYSQIRIMHNGENYVPDYNLIDYSITRFPINFLDRNFYLPGCADFVDDRFLELQYQNRNFDESILKEKTYFADFVYGHDSENNERSEFFHLLSQYKRIESAGSFLNNMAGGYTVSFLDKSKLGLQKKCKFSICFESAGRNEIVTEKISDAFRADAIPIYMGGDGVDQIFNEQAFINCGKFRNFKEVIDRVKEIDQNDELYLDMLRQPIFAKTAYPEMLYNELEKFVCQIFDQPISEAYRRCQVGFAMRYDRLLKKIFTNPGSKLLCGVNRLIKR